MTENFTISVDFGNDFKGEPLMTLTEDYVINSANEIDCTDFNKNCKWMSMGRGPEVLVRFNEWL